jgi:hypothetical protein
MTGHHSEIYRNETLIMIRVSIFILSMLYSILASGSEQISDLFSIERKIYPIDELPLDQLYASDHLSKTVQQPFCTGSRRGYQASWYLAGDYLWLDSIRKNPCDDKYEYIDSTVLFGNKQYPIKAEWFTGSVSLQVGERQYKYGKDETDLLGYDVDIFVFNFDKGKLVSKGMQVYSWRNK